MAHHSSDADPEMAKILKEFHKSQGLTDAFSERLAEKLGATGQFPEGKLTKHDEGELAFAVFTKDGKVVVDFNTEVTWFGMNPDQAIALAELLVKHAGKIIQGG